MRRVVIVLFIPLLLFLFSCNATSKDKTVNKMINSADLTLRHNARIVIKSTPPQLYSDGVMLHPLLHDPFFQVQYASSSKTMLVGGGQDAVYVLDGEEQYSVYKVNTLDMSSKRDGGIANGDTSGTLLGLDKTFGFVYGQYGTTHRTETREALFVNEDKYIIPGRHGIYVVGRGNNGTEKCIWEEDINTSNFSYDGQYLYFCTEAKVFKRIHVETGEISVIREGIMSAWMTDVGYYANQVTDTGYQIIYHNNADDVDKVLSEGWFWQLCEVGDAVFYIRLTGDTPPTYRLYRCQNGKEEVVMTESVIRIGMLDNQTLCYETQSGTLLSVTLDGIITTIQERNEDNT